MSIRDVMKMLRWCGLATILLCAHDVGCVGTGPDDPDEERTDGGPDGASA